MNIWNGAFLQKAVAAASFSFDDSIFEEGNEDEAIAEFGSEEAAGEAREEATGTLTVTFPSGHGPYVWDGITYSQYRDFADSGYSRGWLIDNGFVPDRPTQNGQHLHWGYTRWGW